MGRGAKGEEMSDMRPTTEAEMFSNVVSRLEVCLSELKGMPAPATKAEAIYIHRALASAVEALDTAVGFVVYAQRAK